MTFSIKGWKGDFQPFGNKKNHGLNHLAIIPNLTSLDIFLGGDLNDPKPPCKE